MVCPKCGGRQQRPLAPNYYECQSQIEVETVRAVPEPGAPPGSGRMVALREVHLEACGNRYQAGAPPVTAGGTAPQCACGMFAVGGCVDCGALLCGEHGARFDGAFVCAADYARREQLAAQVVWERQAPQRAAEEQQRKRDLADLVQAVQNYERDRRSVVEAILREADPAGRLLLAIAHTFRVDELSREPVCAAPEVLCHLFPGMFGRGLDDHGLEAPADLGEAAAWYSDRGRAVGAAINRPVRRGSRANPNDRGSYTPEARPVPWDSAKIAKWFAGRAEAAKVPYAQGRALWFEPRWRSGPPKHGWVFASTTTLTFASYTEKSPRSEPMYVDKRGDCWRRGSDGRPTPGGEIALGALMQMVNALRLRRNGLLLSHPWDTIRADGAVVPRGGTLSLKHR
jgi:hypothetical protein